MSPFNNGNTYIVSFFQSMDLSAYYLTYLIGMFIYLHVACENINCHCHIYPRELLNFNELPLVINLIAII